MILNKVMIAIVGLSILSAPVAHSGFMDFAKRGFKSCTDNCKVSACANTEKRAWCVKNCSYKKGESFKIDMTKLCKDFDNYNPNKPYSAIEQRGIDILKNK